MTTPHHCSSQTPWVVGIALVALGSVFGCASSKKDADHPQRDKDTLVPQANQREAEQLYGQQQLFMNDLNATTSEQAGAQHEAAVDRTREPARDPHQK